MPVLLRATVQFTKVLLSFKTVAVHWDVPSKVTSLGVHDMVMVGAVADVLGDPCKNSELPAPKSAQKRRRFVPNALCHAPSENFAQALEIPPPARR